MEAREKIAAVPFVRLFATPVFANQNGAAAPEGKKNLRR